MGKAAVDLPDPLDPASNPVNRAVADDLLSQLAGEQIDQLLHEAPPKTEGPASIAPEPVSEQPHVHALPEHDDSIDQFELEDQQRAALAQVLNRAAESEEEPLPLLLRPLQWINAPFPPRVRRTLGQVGIVLLISAIGLLIYVVISAGR